MGDVSMIVGDRRAFTCVAEEECQLIQVKPALFRSLKPQTAINFIKVMHARLAGNQVGLAG